MAKTSRYSQRSKRSNKLGNKKTTSRQVGVNNNIIHRTLFFNYTTTLISYVIDVSSKSVDQAVSRNSLISQVGYGGYAMIFSEVRVHNIAVHYKNEAAVTEVGSILLNVSDDGQVDGSDFDYVATAPGSSLGRAYQDVKSRWFPTEPDDRNYSDVSDKTTISRILLKHSSNSAKLSGRILVMARVTFRGRADKAKSQLVALDIAAKIRCAQMGGDNQVDDVSDQFETVAFPLSN